MNWSLVRLEGLRIGPKKWFPLRLRTQRLSSNVRGSKESCRLRTLRRANKVTNHIIPPTTHGSNISPTNIYIVNNRVKFSEMCPVIGDDVTQFIQMINSFFPALQVPTELTIFLICLASNYNDL
ncbi:hypothetical protein Pyn_01120 [Prunus yedoensis var. nudiflora]|uniref:Uncharacterized protein n=1 Tax=Prunus yedoensis var. nudiflora TaxID=2094558 RepID=A0A314YLL0_PRUYE|nr:hypothetical protein Pyn_01120 [Prunus yedoensis var. nudiflora]